MPLRLAKVLILAFSCLFATGALAADSASEATKPQSESTKKTAKKAAAPKKLVDINSARKAELMKLPFIGSEEADRIIAGRPFLTKAHLVTKGYISPGAYEAIKRDIIARQDSKPKK